MATTWLSSNVKCPFFVSESNTQKSIYCKGITQDSKLRITFDTLKGKKQQMEIFCCGKYRNCEIYRAIAEQYGE